MARPTTWIVYVGAYVVCALTPHTLGQFNCGSDGSDGAFHPTSDICIDLSKAAGATWNSSSPTSGEGIYDVEKWAVVYKYASVTIPAGVTVRFSNHPKGAPLVWLVQGDVTIEGNIILDGMAGDLTSEFPLPGPGGFCGGRAGLNGQESSGGFGPGGANHTGGAQGAGGGYATEGESETGLAGGGIYGNEQITPLIGGSGGSAGVTGNGGAGGGAILIAANGCIDIAAGATISARGGNGGAAAGGGGSGGAVRLMAGTISGNGHLIATGGTAGGVGVGDGGMGRVRLEAGTIEFTGTAEPAATHGTPDFVFQPNSTAVLRLIGVNTSVVPADPAAAIFTADLSTRNSDSVVLTIEGKNIQTGITVTVHVRPEAGAALSFVSTPLTGTFAASVATAEVQLPKKRCEIYLEANWQP